jgi:tetratricopeptide (TPR) repeat protein
MSTQPGYIVFSRWSVLVFTLFILSFSAAAQTQQWHEQLCENCTRAQSDSEKVIALGKLATYYFALREDAKGDSVVERQIMLAEETRNKELIVRALFENPRFLLLGTITRTAYTLTTEDTRKFLPYLNRCLEYARSIRSNEYIALAYRNFSLFYIKEGNYNQAFQYANLANTVAIGTRDNSLKVICALQLGYTHLQIRELAMSYKAYSNAMDIADLANDYKLDALVYQHFADLYRKLAKNEEAKEYMYQSVDLHRKNNDANGLIEDYLYLGKLLDYDHAVEYLEKAERLADSTKDMFAKIDAQRILFNYKIFLRNPSVPLTYLDHHPELKGVFERTGAEYLSLTFFEVFLYAGKSDTAYLFFKRSEHILDLYSVNYRQSFWGEFAECCLNKGDISNAIKYYEKALEMTRTTSLLNLASLYSLKLRDIYSQQKNYELAFKYSILNNTYKDSLNARIKEKDLSLMEIDNINRQRQRENELAELEEARKHNLQYMGITVIVACIFLLLISFGMFPVSQRTIHILGFFAFIFFFELIILLTEKFIHHFTHGEPLKIWLVKIVLLSMLLPLHHLLEDKLVKYLVSKQLLLHLNQGRSINKILSYLKVKKVKEQEKEEV